MLLTEMNHNMKSGGRSYKDMQSQQTTRSKSKSKNKQDLNNIIEFFDPIKKKKGTLRKKNMRGKIKDKGST